jgi:NDP-sugar pyrophosphorylase family protein
VEAIILAGGKAERLGDAAGGRPKALVEVGGRPLVSYQVARLGRAGVERVIISCAAGQGRSFERELAGLGPEVVSAEEPERLGRGGGIRFAAEQRREPGEVFALNGDELVAVDFGALLGRHREAGGAATIAVARPRSPFGVVSLGDGDAVEGFSEGGQIPYWVSCGIYVLSDEALDAFPTVGDHESSTFPALAAARRLFAYRHEGLWLTVNTPKELRAASEHLAENPEWLN